MRARLFSSLAAMGFSTSAALAQPPAESITPPTLPECVCPTQLPDPSRCPSKYLPEPCASCPSECSTPRWWGGVDYLLWFPKDMPFNAAVFTQSTPGAVNGVPPGAIGNPNTRILYGANPIDFGSFNGGRAEVGYWFNPARTLGAQARGFVLERGGEFFFAQSALADPLGLYRPFHAQTPTFVGEEAAAVGVGPLSFGSAYAAATTHLWGFDADAVWNMRDRSCYRLDATVGFRYLDLRETLTLGGVNYFRGPRGAQTDTEVVDTLGTRNQFYGPQFGAKLTLNYGRIDLLGTAKLALGTTHEIEDNAGFTYVNGVSKPAERGLLVSQFNEGTLVRDRFAVIPEVGVKASYRVTENLNATFGYDFLYLSNVVRPGDQVNRALTFDVAANRTGPSAAAVPGDYFAHGFSVGVGFTY